MEFFPNPPGVNPAENHGTQLIVSGAIMFAISTIVILLRLLSRRLLHLPFQLEDWLIVVAWLFASADSFIVIRGTYHVHFGQPIANSTPTSLTNFLISLYVFQIFYSLAIGISKLSMLALYWRIFHVDFFRVPVIVTTMLTSGWLIMSVLLCVLSCNPVKASWEFMLQLTGEAKCIDSLAFYIGQGAYNLLIDAILLTMPIVMISRLRIAITQKAAVGSIFVLGGIVTCCSALRLWQLVLTQDKSRGFNPTLELTGPAVWSMVESHLSIVCACLPSMRPLLRFALHGRLGTTQGGRVTPGGSGTLDSNMAVRPAQHSFMTLDPAPAAVRGGKLAPAGGWWPWHRATTRSKMQLPTVTNELSVSVSSRGYNVKDYEEDAYELQDKGGLMAQVRAIG